MRIFKGTSSARAPRRRRPPASWRLPGLCVPAWRARAGTLAARDEDGFILLEVIMSALLIALIVVATFNSFDVSSRVSAEQRRHNQAALLAGQSQEQLRTDPANTLEALEVTPHSYTQTVGGTIFTVTETAKFINDSTNSATCTAVASEASKQSGSYIQITSAVTWSSIGNRAPVEQSGIITPPTGSALQVDVLNGATPEEGVSGVGAKVEYTGIESSSATSINGTTGSDGCVVFGAIPATSATLKITPPTGYVNPAGFFAYKTETATLAPNITTHETYTLNRGGSIKGEFVHAGVAVTGETFVAFNTKMVTSPNYLLGDTKFAFEAGEEEKYTPEAGTLAATAQTAIHGHYNTGDAFPWGAASKYIVYAGDCPENYNSTKLGETYEEAAVLPGEATTVKIPTSQVALNVYTGKTAGTFTTEALEVKTTNTKCASAVANNATAALSVHKQLLSGGHLSNPYQPFGTFSMCVNNASKTKSYTVSYTNSTVAGSTRNIYLGEEKTTAEQTYASAPC